MSTTSTYATIEIVHVICGTQGCGMHFGLERTLYNARRKDGGHFYCPNGHYVNWSDTENDKLRADKLRLEARLEHVRNERDDAQKHASVQMGRATRFKNERDRIKTRIANGVCPCCNRSFQNVKRHMTTKHPNFVIPAGDE